MDFDPRLLGLDTYMGSAALTYGGVGVPKDPYARGCRQFFNIRNQFFIKVCYGQYRSQCEAETYTYGRIEEQDLQYFTELLYACDFKSTWHYTVWRYVKLQEYPDYGDRLHFECMGTVNRLCEKYHIDDVFSNGLNWNWFIHNGKPLIVDIGCS